MEKQGSVAQSNAKPKRSKLKWILRGLIVLVVLLVLLIVMLPTLLSTPPAKSLLLGQINSRMTGQVQIADLSLGWLSGVRALGLVFEDPGNGTLVKVREFRTKPQWLSLLSGRLSFLSTVVDRPEVEIIMPASPAGKTPSDGSSKPTTEKTGGGFAMPLDTLALEVKDGRAMFAMADTKQRVEINNITTTVNLNPAGQLSTAVMNLAVAGVSGQGDIKANAQITPGQGWSMEGAGGQVEFDIANLKLEDLKPLLEIAGKPMDIGGTVDGKGQIKMTNGKLEVIDAAMTVDKFRHKTGDKQTMLDMPIKIKALASQTDKGFRVDNLNIDSSICKATCQGDMEKMDYQLDVDDIAKAMDVASPFVDLQGLSLGGDLSAKGTVQMAKDVIDASGTMEIKQFAAAKGQKKTGSSVVKLDYAVQHDGAKKILNGSSVNLAMDAGTVNLKNIRLPLGQFNAASVSVDASAALDLQKTLAMAAVFASVPEDTAISGLLKSQVSVSPEAGSMRIRTDKTTIEKLSITKAKNAPFVQELMTLTANVLLNLDQKKYNIENFDLQGQNGQTVIRAKGNFGQTIQKEITSMQGDFQADYDLAAISAMAAPVMPADLKIAGKRSNRFTFQSAYPTAQPDKMLANLNADGGFGFDQADYMGLRFGPTQMTFKAVKGLVTLDMPAADVNGGKVRFAGSADFNKTPAVLVIKEPMQVVENVAINDVVTNQLLKFLNPAFSKGTQVKGIANLNCRSLSVPLASGQTQTIQVDANVEIADIVMNPGNFLGQIISFLGGRSPVAMRLRPTDVLIKDNYIQYKNMQIDIEDKPLNFHGSMGFDKKIAMDVELPWKLSGGTVKSDQPTATDRVVVPIKGSVDSPDIDLNKLIQKQAEGLIQQEIQKGLQKLFDK